MTASINSGYIIGTWAGADKTSFDIGAPEHNEGDLIFIAFIIQANTNISLNDFTELFADATINDSTFSLFYKVATDSEPSTYTITTANAERGTWVAWGVTNHDGINTDVLTDETTGTTVTQPSHTTTVDDCLDLFIIATRLDSTPMLEGIANKVADISGASAGSLGLFSLPRPTAGTFSGGTICTLTNNRARRTGVVSIAPGPFTPPSPPAADVSPQRIRTYLPA